MVEFWGTYRKFPVIKAKQKLQEIYIYILYTYNFTLRLDYRYTTSTYRTYMVELWDAGITVGLWWDYADVYGASWIGLPWS